MYANKISYAVAAGASCGAQKEIIEGRHDMIQNKAGGYTFSVSPREHVMRILILGTDSNTYYTNAGQLTTESLAFITKQIEDGNGKMVLDSVMEVYRNSRAPKLNYGFIVHAMLCRAKNLELRRAALTFVKEYRTLSHLYSWKAAHKSAGNSKGFGRLVKRILTEKITSTAPMQLAYQITKYGQRTVGGESWSFTDLLGCIHIRTGTGENRECKVKDPITAQKNATTASELDIVLRYANNG